MGREGLNKEHKKRPSISLRGKKGHANKSMPIREKLELISGTRFFEKRGRDA